jgi:hypothetical protein
MTDEEIEQRFKKYLASLTEEEKLWVFDFIVELREIVQDKIREIERGR